MSEPAATEGAAERRAPRRFYGVCAGLWLFFALIAWLTPIMLDDWFEVVFIKKHGLSWASIWQYASYNYVNYNPRLGETLLLVVNGPRVIHVLLTPTVELLLLFVVFALAHGRWPRPSARDAQRLLVAQALMFMVVPSVGLLYFYRPYVTNYLFGFCIQLLLFVPYRFELTRAAASVRPAWFTPLLLVAGLAAGMTNEHTGPTAMLVLAAATVLLWRRARPSAWSVAGVLGLWMGYFLLFFAPGQAKRYGGAAAKASPIATIVDRGFAGAQEVINSFVWEGQLAITIVLVAAVVAILGARRRGATLAPVARLELAVTLVALAAAAMMIGTVMASPMVGERLYFAPCVLLVIGVLPFVNVMLVERGARRFLVACALIVVSYQVVRTTVEFVMARVAFDRRMAILEAAPAGGRAEVPPYLRWSTTKLFFGDDFRTFTHRQYVAHEYFGLAGIDLVHAGPWAEPRPPFEVEYRLHFDPPLAEAEWRKHADLATYTPSYAEWLVAALRQHLPELTSIPGHRLARVEVAVHGLDLPELAGRPLIWLKWQDGKYLFPEGGVLIDERLMPYFIVKRPNLPPDLKEAWVVGCGRTQPVPIRDSAKGAMLPWQPECRGSYVAIACSTDLCWLAAVTWR